MARSLSTPLLELLNYRWERDPCIKEMPDPTWDRPFKRPKIEDNFARRTAKLAAEADNSDPFAGARAFHHIKTGIANVNEVRDDALRLTQARRAQGATFPTVELKT